MHLHWERSPNVAGDCNIRSLSWMGRVPDEIPQVKTLWWDKLIRNSEFVFFTYIISIVLIQKRLKFIFACRRKDGS